MSRSYRHIDTDNKPFYQDFHTAKLQFRKNKLPESLNEQPSNISTQLNVGTELERYPYGGKSHRRITLRKKDKKNHRRSHHRRRSNKKSRKGCKSRKLRRRVRL
jgi:hypothetical protein